MTMGMMEAYRQAVKKFSGIKKLTNKAIQNWLERGLLRLPPHAQQMFVDEVFFLSTGLPPMRADRISASKDEAVSLQGGKPGVLKRDSKAEENAFWIQREAVEVFGTEDKASEWLTRKSHALKNKTPLSILGTKAGNTRVEKMLKKVRESPLPVQPSIKKLKTVASRKARFVNTIRKATD